MQPPEPLERRSARRKARFYGLERLQKARSGGFRILRTSTPDTPSIATPAVDRGDVDAVAGLASAAVPRK
jgi:hypothetical protein